MKRAIEQDAVKAGDLIRWESDVDDNAHEFRASCDRSFWARGGQHYLLDRPAPAVEYVDLPDKWSATIHLRIGEPQPQYGVVQLNAYRDASDELISCDVNKADFLAALTRTMGVTAVPTSALDELRAEHDRDGDRDGCGHVRDFLAAVDEAGDPR